MLGYVCSWDGFYITRKYVIHTDHMALLLGDLNVGYDGLCMYWDGY